MARLLLEVNYGGMNKDLLMKIKSYFFLISLLTSMTSFSAEVQINFTAGKKRLKCNPDPRKEKCNDAKCGNASIPSNQFYKCRFVLKSKKCLKRRHVESRPGSRHRYNFQYWRPEDKRGCLKYSYGVNILLNRAAVFSKDPIDLTYFLHGRIKWYHGFLVEGVTKNGTEGAVTRLHLEKQIQKVKKPIAFISPEFITDPATMSRDAHHFSQFKKEAAWLEFQETVEQFLGTKKRGIARRNLMVHSQSYARVARMKNWKNVRFNSTTLLILFMVNIKN